MEFLVEINSEVGYDYTLPINNIANANMDVVVDWGDASGTDHITDYTDTAAIHHYAGASTFTIKITGQMKWLDLQTNQIQEIKPEQLLYSKTGCNERGECQKRTDHR